MTSTTPRVSIGLPVYNGARHLEECLASLRSQTLEDYEIVARRQSDLVGLSQGTSAL